MLATVVDLRYRMKDVLTALDRRETVGILYHGRLKGTIVPVDSNRGRKVSGHAFFGMRRDDVRPVGDVMQDLRGGRHHVV